MKTKPFVHIWRKSLSTTYKEQSIILSNFMSGRIKSFEAPTQTHSELFCLFAYCYISNQKQSFSSHPERCRNGRCPAAKLSIVFRDSQAILDLMTFFLLKYQRRSLVIRVVKIQYCVRKNIYHAIWLLCCYFSQVYPLRARELLRCK